MGDRISTELLSRHAQDAYRVAYLYALEAHIGQPEREEIAEHAGEAAVARLLGKEKMPKERALEAVG